MNADRVFSQIPCLPARSCWIDRSSPLRKPSRRSFFRRPAADADQIRETSRRSGVLFVSRYIISMAYKAVDSTSKKLIQIDVSSDTVCPWCFVGKKNLEKAMNQVKDQFNFEVKWHPFLLNPHAPKEGIKKSEFYKNKFGSTKSEQIISRMREVFRGLGFEYDTAGMTGSTLDSHRLISFAANQGHEKQTALVEELFQNYFIQGKYIGDNQVLMDAANKVGIEGATELINDPEKGLKEVKEELQKYSSHISGVPHFVINGSYVLSGGQPPEAFLHAFEAASK